MKKMASPLRGSGHDWNGSTTYQGPYAIYLCYMTQLFFNSLNGNLSNQCLTDGNFMWQNKGNNT